MSKIERKIERATAEYQKARAREKEKLDELKQLVVEGQREGVSITWMIDTTQLARTTIYRAFDKAGVEPRRRRKDID